MPGRCDKRTHYGCRRLGWQGVLYWQSMFGPKRECMPHLKAPALIPCSAPQVKAYYPLLLMSSTCLTTRPSTYMIQGITALMQLSFCLLPRYALKARCGRRESVSASWAWDAGNLCGDRERCCKRAMSPTTTADLHLHISIAMRHSMFVGICALLLLTWAELFNAFNANWERRENNFIFEACGRASAA
jgi:hypothetical protein